MFTRLLAISVATVAVAAPALAQQQPAAGAKPAAPAAQQAATPTSAIPPISGPQPDWIKICQTDPRSKKEICQISRDLRAETGQTLAQVAVRQEKGGKRSLVLAIPPGMQIQPGLRVLVDTKAVVAAKFQVCFPTVCVAEAEASDDVLGQLKTGTTLTLQSISVQGQGIGFPIGLKGFGKVFDGPPIDPKAVQSEQEQLRKKLEEAAKKAQEQAAGQQ